MWTALFIRFLRRLIRKGHLVVSVGDSGEISFGDGDGPKVTVRIKDQPTARRLMRDPELALGEAYMDGALSIESDDVQGLLGVAMRNRTHAEGLPATARVLAAVRHVRRRLDQSNPEAGARRNVAHHYDLTPAIYDLFLDVVRQYSCAYFANDTMTLEVAYRQQAVDHAGDAGSGYRVWLGWLGADAGERLRRSGDSNHLVAGATDHCT